MVDTSSSSSQKSPAVPRRVDTVELLHLAQLFLDIHLEHHQASLLSDLIFAATDASSDGASAGPNVPPSASTAPVPGPSAPPAYATQAGTAAAQGSVSSPAHAAHGTSTAAVNAVPPTQQVTVSPVAAPVVPVPAAPVAAPAPAVPAAAPAVPAAAPVPAVAGNASLPANNHGFAHYQVLPVTFPYERPTYGTPGPYYAITRGRVVGVVAGWDKASPFCIGVGGAVFRSVPSIDMGRQVVEAALSAGSCMLLP